MVDTSTVQKKCNLSAVVRNFLVRKKLAVQYYIFATNFAKPENCISLYKINIATDGLEITLFSLPTRKSPVFTSLQLYSIVTQLKLDWLLKITEIVTCFTKYH